MKDKRLTSMEYCSVLRAAGREGWLAELAGAHAIPCEMEQAQRILDGLGLPAGLRLRWGRKSACAYYNPRKGTYRLSFPSVPGGKWGRLRVGIVLHEAAHIFQRQKDRNREFKSHGPEFQTELRQLLGTNWRVQMPTSSFREIFGRHRGPYSIALTRTVKTVQKTMQKSDYLVGTFTAEEAHEECRMLVTDPRETVTSAYVYSETEGQFIGAIYNRGEQYRSWADERTDDLTKAGLELPVERPEATLVRDQRDEPVQEMAAAEPANAPARTVPGDPAVSSVPEAPRPLTPTPPKKISRPLTLGPGAAERWPKSEAAQEVLRVFLLENLTAKVAAERVGPKLVELRVAHPASLISRLKQAGLLVEVVDANN